MKKKKNNLHKFNTIAEYLRILSLPTSLHPLIAFIDNSTVTVEANNSLEAYTLGFYQIGFKTNLRGKSKYGQSHYDFDDGGLVFSAPNQLLGIDSDTVCSNYTLVIHPDFFRTYPLAKNIQAYSFFSYAVNESLHISEKETQIVLSVFRNIDEELKGRIDDFSQDVIISYIELLLNYCNRFYKRQFITRKALNHDLLQQLESILDNYFNREQALEQGIPTVQFLAEQLNLSPGYLSDMLRSITGQNTQQHIHQKLIEKAKEKLSTTNSSISEIAYELGFVHPQSFSKLFKTKTKFSPLEYRESFN